MIAQLKDSILIILLAAAGVSALTGFLSGHNEWTEVIIILAVVLLNAILGVFQENEAEAAIEALQTMTAATCKVPRDGKMVVLEAPSLIEGQDVVLGRCTHYWTEKPAGITPEYLEQNPAFLFIPIV